jgi:rubrerythrin
MDINELKTIKTAIINEIQGYEFYKMAANQAPTEEAKEALLILAQEEFNHIEWLKNLFDSIKNGKDDDFELSNLPDINLPNIFKWEKNNSNNYSLAVSIYGIGIEMEKRSIEFYNEASKTTNIQRAKYLYELLEAWEKAHLSRFEKDYNDLMDEWWSEQGFAPF